MRYLEMFAGVGGFSLGIGDRGECVGFSEIDKYANQVLKYHFPEITNYGDCTKIIASELPDFDLLVGGFPCQSFSIAGKRGGFKDTRGTMFFEIARIARVKRPAYLLLENVKGLLNHDKGNTFATIISTLDELGYDCEWCVLNSKNFGVPQNRERVFIIGYFRGKCSGKVFPIGESSKTADELCGQQTGAITARRGTAKSDGNYIIESKRKALREITENQSQGYRVYDPQGLATSQASQGGGLGAKTGLYAIRTRSSNPMSDIIPKVIYENNKKDLQVQMYRKLVGGEGINGSSLPNLSDTKIRRLTPTECERLQAFPDNWTKWGINEKGEKVEMSDTQRYKMMGNALTTNVVQAIIERLI